MFLSSFFYSLFNFFSIKSLLFINNFNIWFWLQFSLNFSNLFSQFFMIWWTWKIWFLVLIIIIRNLRRFWILLLCVNKIFIKFWLYRSSWSLKNCSFIWGLARWTVTWRRTAWRRRWIWFLFLDIFLYINNNVCQVIQKLDIINLNCQFLLFNCQNFDFYFSIHRFNQARIWH